MNIINYTLLAGFLILYGCKASLAQPKDVMVQYDTAKTYLTSERYSDAILLFGELARKNERTDIGANSNYYLAYAYYKIGSLKDANFVLFQLINKYPSWNTIDMAYYLKGIVQFEAKNYFDAFTQWQKVQTSKYQKETAKAKYYFLGRLTNDTLQVLANRFPQDQELKNFIHQRLDTLDVLPKGRMLKVAVLLPFESSVKNHFVYEFYTGLQLAADSLKNEGININLFPVETDKDSVKVQRFVNNPDTENFDMVIGPLYTSQQKYVDEFADRTHIPVINPLSNYAPFSDDNSCYFLFQPGYEAQGKIAAQFSYKNFTRKKTAVIVYGSAPGDTLIASAYKKAFEKMGGKVLIYKMLNKAAAGYFGTVLGKVVVDSVGHVFVSSADPLLAANVFSALEGSILEKAAKYKETSYANVEKEDEIKKLQVSDVPVIVPHEWIDFQSVTFDQLMMHNTHFIYPGFVDTDSIPNHTFDSRYLAKTGLPATSYSYQGYDLLLLFGRALREKGHKLTKYFDKNGTSKGYALRYFNFAGSNSNKYVPIVKIEDYKLKQANIQPDDIEQTDK